MGEIKGGYEAQSETVKHAQKIVFKKLSREAKRLQIFSKSFLNPGPPSKKKRPAFKKIRSHSY
jgi:hypothetical protein